ncbi:hypothetical protein C8R44DRAFT_988361 [Mycena epipterygia]|nr:hypothetical protein C8R44DRAFT_988361 [Mycena epipterygia]
MHTGLLSNYSSMLAQFLSSASLDSRGFPAKYTLSRTPTDPESSSPGSASSRPVFIHVDIHAIVTLAHRAAHPHPLTLVRQPASNRTRLEVDNYHRISKSFASTFLILAGPDHPPSSAAFGGTVTLARNGGGGVIQVVHTDDTATKLSVRVRRRRFYWCPTDTSTWRCSNLFPVKSSQQVRPLRAHTLAPTPRAVPGQVRPARAPSRTTSTANPTHHLPPNPNPHPPRPRKTTLSSNLPRNTPTVPPAPRRASQNQNTGAQNGAGQRGRQTSPTPNYTAAMGARASPGWGKRGAASRGRNRERYEPVA